MLLTVLGFFYCLFLSFSYLFLEKTATCLFTVFKHFYYEAISVKTFWDDDNDSDNDNTLAQAQASQVFHAHTPDHDIDNDKLRVTNH